MKKYTDKNADMNRDAERNEFHEAHFAVQVITYKMAVVTGSYTTLSCPVTTAQRETDRGSPLDQIPFFWEAFCYWYTRNKLQIFLSSD